MCAEDSVKRISWGGIIAILAALVLVAVFWPVLKRPNPDGWCLNNVKQLGTALHMYQTDYGSLPVLRTTAQRSEPGKSWPDAMTQYIIIPTIFSCPKSDDKLTYSFNRRLSGIREKDVTANPADVVLIFESVTDSPANNNLNGDEVWREGDSTYPRVGQFVQWPSKRKKYYREWPDWAKPRHEGRNMVAFLDGHVKACEPGYEPLFDPKMAPNPQ